MKMLELALHDGFDVRTGKYIGARTGDPAAFAHASTTCSPRSTRRSGTSSTSRSAATRSSSGCTPTRMPHTFLSVITDDCIAKGKDYNAGGARYNNTFIQAVGIGSITDSLSALKELVFDAGDVPLAAASSRCSTPTSPARSRCASACSTRRTSTATTTTTPTR